MIRGFFGGGELCSRVIVPFLIIVTLGSQLEHLVQRIVFNSKFSLYATQVSSSFTRWFLGNSSGLR